MKFLKWDAKIDQVLFKFELQNDDLKNIKLQIVDESAGGAPFL